MNEVPEPIATPFRFDVLTLFPPLFDGFLTESIIGRAIRNGLVEVKLWDLRQWALNRYGQVDDRPFGGGPGMLIMAPPVVEGVRTILLDSDIPGHLVMMTPSGRRFDQSKAREFLATRRIVLLCGRYEGFDHRVNEILGPETVSIGDYVLSGGEVPAMVIIDAVTRLVPGALGDETSPLDESFHDERRLVEYPQYTRPREYLGYSVPEILLSGDHAKIARWRESLRRPSDPPQDTGSQ
jgi:tRNA (guanine37-N1)-methyltransferase